MVRFEDYPIVLCELSEDEGGGYLAFLPDFGLTCCSGAGDDIAEALELLEDVYEDIVKIMEEDGRPLPQPTGFRDVYKKWKD